MRRIRSRAAAFACAIACSPAVAQTTPEQHNSPGAYQIRAPGSSPSGAGTTAAILDTGIMGVYADGMFVSTHSEFGSDVLKGYNAFDGSADVRDGNGHGTHVAGIVAAHRDNPASAGMFGPAFNASVLPVKVLGNDGWGSHSVIADGIRFAVRQKTAGAIAESHRPSVINMSLSSDSASSEVIGALKQAVAAGMVIVVAAGNQARPNPDYPARHAKNAWANGQILAVGAVDSRGRLATFSNRAGDAASFYLVAPGVNIYSTFPDGGTAGYALMSGTSMAAPYVTAGAVLIKSTWPYLGAPQIADILLTSARDLGEPGPDAVYGRGLIDLEAALLPLGSLSAPASSGGFVPLDGASLTTSAPTSAALRGAARAGQFRFAAFDRYGRDFQVDLAPSVRRVRSPENGFGAMFSALDSRGAVHRDRVGNHWRLDRRSEATRLALSASGGGEAVSLSALDARGHELAVGFSGTGGNAFGLAGELAREDASAPLPALANPFFSLAPQHGHVAAGLPIAGNVRLKVGALLSDSTAPPSGLEPQLSDRRQTMVLAELAATSGSNLWSFSLGRLQENQSVLGSAYVGAFDWRAEAGTTVATLGVARDFGTRLKIGAQYSMGATDAAGSDGNSLFTGVTRVRSESHALFASLRDTFRRDDNLSLTLSQPLRPVSGALEMTVPVGAAADGSPVLQQRSIPLQPAGRELRADLLYLAPLDRDTTWSLGGTVRRDPEHDPAASTEKFVGLGLRKVF